MYPPTPNSLASTASALPHCLADATCLGYVASVAMDGDKVTVKVELNALDKNAATLQAFVRLHAAHELDTPNAYPAMRAHTRPLHQVQLASAIGSRHSIGEIVDSRSHMATMQINGKAACEPVDVSSMLALPDMQKVTSKFQGKAQALLPHLKTVLVWLHGDTEGAKKFTKIQELAAQMKAPLEQLGNMIGHAGHTFASKLFKSKQTAAGVEYQLQTQLANDFVQKLLTAAVRQISAAVCRALQSPCTCEAVALVVRRESMQVWTVFGPLRRACNI